MWNVERKLLRLYRASSDQTPKRLIGEEIEVFTVEIKQAAAGDGFDELMHGGFSERLGYSTLWSGRNAQNKWEIDKPIDEQQLELPYLLITVNYLLFITKANMVLKAVLALLKEAYDGFDDVYAADDLRYATTTSMKQHLLIFARSDDIPPIDFADEHNPFKHNNNMFDEETWNVEIKHRATSSSIVVEYSLTRNE